MSVSIEAYRSRIGQFFNPSRKYKMPAVQKSSKCQKIKAIPTRTISICILTLVASLLVNPHVSFNPESIKVTTKSPSLPQFEPLVNIRPPSPSNKIYLPLYSRFYFPPPQKVPEDNNFLARYKYGNKRDKKNGITIMHWNKGPSLLSNKMHDLENIIDKYRPHVLGLSEGNLRKFDDESDVQLKDYNLHTCPTINNLEHGVSRVVVYTHKSIVVKPRPDLMNPWVSSIWLEVGLPRQRKFLLCNGYREWGYPNQPDKSSHSHSAQKDRWTMFLDQWEAGILEDKEIIVLGDLNICHNKWTRLDLSPSEQTYKLKPLIVELFERIIPQGFCQLVRGFSYVKQGQDKSGLDHLYTNKVDKLSEV